MGDESFTAQNSTLNHDYTGTVQVLPSGFKKLTIGTTSDSGVSVGDVFYTIELPNTALIASPANGPAVVACGLGDAPTGDSLKYNWIAIPERDWTIGGSPAYGTAEFTKSGLTYSGEIISRYANDAVKNQFTDGFTYNSGSLTQPNDPDMNGAMTPSGTFMLDFGPQRGGAIGVQRPAVNIDPVAMSTKNFIAVVDRGNESHCVSVTGQGDGSFIAHDFIDMDAGTLDMTDEGTSHVTLGEQVEPGLFKATLETQGLSFAFVVVANKVKGKWVVYGFGTDEGAYNVMLVEK